MKRGLQLPEFRKLVIAKSVLHLRLRVQLPPLNSTTLVSLARALAPEETKFSVLPSMVRVNSSHVVRE
jgi:hypothetical protein